MNGDTLADMRRLQAAMADQDDLRFIRVVRLGLGKTDMPPEVREQLAHLDDGGWLIVCRRTGEPLAGTGSRVVEALRNGR